jgi:MFS family permease
VFGLLGSWFFIKDTKQHVLIETASNSIPRLKNIFWDTTWKNKNLGSVTQAGLINNLNDGMVWGIFPILLSQKNFSIEQIGIVTAIYPAVWGLGQLITGKMADRFCKKDMLFVGMILQGISLLVMPWAQTMLHFIFLSVILGWGTAMVYPTFLATIAENTNPADRAKSLGVFRLWRDLGYAIGAILTGIIADALGISASIIVIGSLTIGSAILIYYRMKCRNDDSIKFWNWLTIKHRSNETCVIE